MNIINYLKLKFKKTEIVTHMHEWQPQYTTGTHDSKWVRGDKVGFGKSTVFKCECGQWSVKHWGDDVYTLLKN